MGIRSRKRGRGGMAGPDSMAAWPDGRPVWRRDSRRLLGLLIGLGLLLALVWLAPWIAGHDPLQTAMALRNAGPSPGHILGTDNLGRDVFARALFGGRSTMLISFSATLASMAVGILFGFLSGWYGRWPDQGIQVLMSIFQGLPGLSISIAVVGIMGSNTGSIILALMLTGWSGVARLVRTQVRHLKGRQYIDAVRLYQTGSWYLFTRHLMPMILPTLTVFAASRMGRMVLTVASLSFIGVGLQPPAPDWGVMIQDARQYIRVQPWSLLAPALMICLTAFVLTRLGECLRDRWDVHRQDSLENL